MMLGPLRTPALAQSRASKLLVLRAGAGDETSEALAEQVDRVLERALVSEAGFETAYFSPTPYEDVELMAGCGGPTPACLRQVASVLRAEWLLVRKLGREGPDSFLLTLFAQNGSTNRLARRALATLTLEGPLTPELVVPRLVNAVYVNPPAEPVVESPPARAPQAKESAHSEVLRAVGWSTLAVGAALLTTGLVLGVLSNHDHDDFEDVVVVTPEDADHAASMLNRSRSRAKAANGCFGAGAVLAAAGVGTLLWDYFRARNAKRDAKTGRAEELGLRAWAQPSHDGASLFVTGSLSRGSR